MMPMRTELRRSKAGALALGMGAWALLGPFALLAAEKVLGYKATVYEIWASDEPPSKEVPKELKKFQKQLQKTTKKKSFRLEKKPTQGEVRDGKPMTLALPGGYQVRLALDTKSRAMSQVLINPKKEESTLLLKKSPVITTIEKVRKGDGTFLILVEFEPLKE